MKTTLINKVFSHSLLLIYSMVMFQQEVIDGIHLLSHASEVLSDNYSYHSHGHGELHFHDHDFMDTVKSIFGHDDKNKNTSNEQIPFQQQIKIHVPALFSSQLVSFPVGLILYGSLQDVLISIYPEVKTPPPRQLS